MTLTEAARRVGITPDTVRRWVRRGLVPQFDGEWTPSAIGAARVVAGMRERGPSLAEIQRATEEGRLAFGFLEELFPAAQARISIRDAARETRLDEAMIVGSDPASLTDWAVGFQTMQTERPLPRIAVHYGVAMYRDGDYYGRDVNIASRMAARSAGGEVLVTRPVVDAVSAPHLEFERIAEVRLKGFSESTEVFIARQREDAEP